MREGVLVSRLASFDIGLRTSGLRFILRGGMGQLVDLVVFDVWSNLSTFLTVPLSGAMNSILIKAIS